MVLGVIKAGQGISKGIAGLTKVGRPKIKLEFAGPKLPPGKLKDPNRDYNIWSTDNLYYDKMRGQIGANQKYNPEFIGPRKGVDAILKKDYTGPKHVDKKTGLPLSRVITARGHKAQANVRPSASTVAAIKSIHSDPSNYVSGYTRGSSVDEYVKGGSNRFVKHDSKAADVHPDFVVPEEYYHHVDFKSPAQRYKHLGKYTGFSSQHEGFLTNEIRNTSYHRHYENNLYRWLTEQKLIKQAYKEGKISKTQMKEDLENAKNKVFLITDDMKKLGLESKVWNKNKNGFDTYGKAYDSQLSGLYKDQKKSYKLNYPPRTFFKNQKEYKKHVINAELGKDYGFTKPVGHQDGGLINDSLSDTIPPNRGPMSDGIPLLDPQESIDRQKFNVGGFANLFGQLQKVPRAVARVGDMVKSVGKAEKATDVTVAQAVEDKPAMFLSTVDAIENMPETSLPAQQWLGTIKNKPGVSATELDEFGLEALLTNISNADPKRKLSKTELLETYNKEMPKIDMDIAMAEPVARGAKDITNMLTKIRDTGRFNESLENLKVLSNDPRLLTALHQPPQDATGMKIRENILNVMQGTNKVTGQEGDPINQTTVSLLKQSYGGKNAELYTGQYFPDLWEKAFPRIYHGTNEIVKRDHMNVLKNLVPAEDVTKLASAKNIPEEEAFKQLYQALNVFDRNVVTADTPIPFWTKKMLYRLGDMSEGRGFFFKSKKSPAHDGAQFIPGGSGYGELKFFFNFDTGAVRAAEKAYDSGHFSGEKFGRGPLTGSGQDMKNAPFGWGRFSERIDENGRKILLMEEIQSDLHQNVAQKGYKYAPRLDKGNVLAEMGDFAAQLDKKMQTLESTRLRKDNIMNLTRVERESPENVAELKNIEKAMKKLVTDVKKLKAKVEEQKQLTGKSGQVHPDAPFKKSENYAKVFLQGLMKMAADKGYDGIALSTGKMKKAHGGIPKGGDKFYDEIGVKAMKRIAKKSGFNFKDTTIVDGNGFTWERIPLIEMRDINTGQRIPGQSTIPVYSKGGFVKQNMVRGNNNGY